MATNVVCMSTKLHGQGVWRICRYTHILVYFVYCLTEGQAIVRSIHAPLANQIAQEVQSSYTGQLPGLPYPELPVVALIGTYDTLETHTMIFPDAK